MGTQHDAGVAERRTRKKNKEDTKKKRNKEEEPASKTRFQRNEFSSFSTLAFNAPFWWDSVGAIRSFISCGDSKISMQQDTLMTVAMIPRKKVVNQAW